MTATRITFRSFSRPPLHGHYHAFTFIELMLTLVIVSVLGAAICAMTVAAMDGDSVLRTTGITQSEVDMAMRRITNNLMECQAGTAVVGTGTLSTLTQPDSAHGYPAGATVSYSLQNDAAHPGQKILTEKDQRYGTNPLVHNVTTFTVAAVAGVADLYQVDLVVGGPIIIERHFKIYARN